MIKDFSRDKEQSIQLPDWLTALSTMEKLVKEIHDGTCASYLERHNQNVTGLTCPGFWQAALKYNIQMCEAWIVNPHMNISILDIE